MTRRGGEIMGESKIANWDWDTKEKLVADINGWKKKFIDIRDLTPSDDGEKIAGVVQPERARFATCVNGDILEETFERLYSVKFNTDNKLLFLVFSNYEWALAVDREISKDKFDFLWNLTLTPDGKGFAVNIKKGDDYGVSLNGKTWGNMFVEARDLAISPDGMKAASGVLTQRLKEGDIFTFQKGLWTIAVDGTPWDTNFVNVWGFTFSPDNKHVAAEVRLNLYEYTIAVDGKTWDTIFSCVWEPIFKPGSTDVVAPVKTAKGWTLAMNGKPIWDNFVQVWRHKYSPDGQRIAAVVAPEYGKWTVAVDSSPWTKTYNDAVISPVFSPDSKRVAAIVKESKFPFHMESALHNIEGNDRWTIAVDGTPWAEDFDMIWDPVFSPGSDKVAAKAERNGKYFVVVDGRVGRRVFEALWNPIFSPDGEKLLIRCIEGGKYYRRIVPLGKI
jgi:hypothetical protein